MSASEAVYGKVAEVLVQALNVDDDEIKPSATLQRDLGAGSIDFLDSRRRRRNVRRPRSSGDP